MVFCGLSFVAFFGEKTKSATLAVRQTRAWEVVAYHRIETLPGVVRRAVPRLDRETKESARKI